MNSHICTVLAVLLMLAPCRQALAWAEQGHTAMWRVTQSLLQEPARVKVNALLQGQDLEDAAMWLDFVRSSARALRDGRPDPLEADTEAHDLNRNFPNNAIWHYVNLPLGATSYAACPEFTAAEDIVQQIKHCIAVLQGKRQDMPERTALRVLIHLVGDLHQPLHCASGYYDLTDPQRPVLVTDPAACIPLRKANLDDRGGNQIKHGTLRLDSLHYDFDVAFPKAFVGNDPSVDLLAAAITPLTEIIPPTPGGPDTWPELWTIESLGLAAKAYQKLVFGACTLRTDPEEIAERGPIELIRITPPPDFTASQATVAGLQLARSSVRLAALLNAIWK